MNKSCVVWVALCLWLSGSGFASEDWPHPRGPRIDGSAAPSGALAEGPIDLEPAWRIPIGSGYSGVAIADGRAVTAFSEGEADWLAAFDASTGTRNWRIRLGAIHKGHDGSDDGPLSSPVTADGSVYVLTPRGELVAVRLEDGEIRWRKDLAGALGAKEPHFGFTSTPLVVGDVVVVQAGGSEGRSIAGLSVDGGDVVWTHGSGEVAYQSPAVMTLAGTLQVVAFDTEGIVGIAPKDGSVLWTQAVGEDDRLRSIAPTFLEDDRFLVFQGRGAAAYRVTRSSDGFGVEEVFRTDAIGNGYAAPVYHDGHVYGFRGQVLTCVDASTGERKWRSRPPGGDGLIVVDGRLVVFAAKGNVVVADASPEGYRELARVQALDGSSLTWPSYADGRVFVRNLSELAALTIRPGADASAGSEARAADHAFGRWVATVGAAPDRRARVDAYLEQHDRMPVVEGRYVHFLYRGPADDVAIAGSMIDAETADVMQRLEGTDLFYRSYELDSGGRWEYHFQIDYADWIPDPLNPRTVPAIEGDAVLSELVSSGYRLGDHVTEPKGPRGTLETMNVSSEKLGADKEVRVWLPPSYGKDDRPHRVIVVNDGEAWLDKGHMAESLDNLIAPTDEPVIVAFVPATRQWWLEAGGSSTDAYLEMLAEELVPALAGRYRLLDRPGAHAVLGNRFFGVSASLAALKYPETFGRVAVQSVFLDLGKGDELRSMIREGVSKGVAFYVDWSPYDERNVDRDWSMTEDSRELAELLRGSGYRVSGGEVLDSAGWGGWRNRTDRLIAALVAGE